MAGGWGVHPICHVMLLVGVGVLGVRASREGCVYAWMDGRGSGGYAHTRNTAIFPFPLLSFPP